MVHTAAAEQARYLSADVDKQGFRDEGTSYTRGHALWRGSQDDGAKRTWLTADLNILRQEPASPHPREGATRSASVPLDANYNPSGAYLDETRIFVSGGFERPVAGGAT